MDYTSKYGEVREKVLSKHFAINKFFRTNYVSDIAPYPEQRYENPLIYTGHLMVCLAIEHQLGNPEALKILRSALESISTLYKFKGNHFDGYIIRYDAVHSNSWKTEPKPDGFFKLDSCENFIRDGAGRYLYVTPLDYYHKVIKNDVDSGIPYDKAYYDRKVQYRYWEPSIDELVGLMMGYDVVFRLVNDPEVQRMVKMQANQLGDYLAEYNYMLVRPSSGFIQKNGASPTHVYPTGMGNFTFRGSMGINPALEYPFGLIFQRITGNSYHSRSSPDKAWEDTVKKAEAGIWDNISNDISDEAVGKLIAEKTAEGILTVSVGGIIGSILDALTGLPVAEFLLGTATASVVGLASSILAPTLEVLGLRDDFLELFNNGDLLRAYIIFKDCKDKFDIDNPGDAAAAYLLSKLEPAERFKIYMQGAAMHMGGYAKSFPRHLAMSCAPISNHQKNLFASGLCDMWLNLYKPIYNPHDIKQNHQRAYAEDTFVKAVGVLLNKGEGWEGELVTMLDQCYNDCIKPVTEIDPTVALDYMSAIALAWMHAKIRAGQGKPVGTPGFTLPVFSNNSPGWPVPGFSKEEIINTLPPKGGEPSPTSTIIPFNSIQSNRNFWNLEYINGKAPLFLDPVPLKPVEPDDHSPSWPECAFYVPPFIEEVAVVQTSSEREPDGFAKLKSDLPCECGTIKYYAYWKEKPDKTRELVVNKNKPLDFRKVAYIFLKSSEVLRPESVKVTLIGETKGGNKLFQQPITMNSRHSERDGEYYFGSFSPSNRWSQNYIIKLEIQAASTAEQYGIRNPKGDEIDSDPKSIAKVDKNNPPLFPYVNYEPGTDCNHQIEMGTYIQSLPPDELEKNNNFQSATYVSLVSDKVDFDPKTIFEDSGKVYGEEKVFCNLKLSDVNDQDYFSIEYSCPKSDDEDNSMTESTTTHRNKYFSIYLTHKPPCLYFSVSNAENYCVDMEIYQCDELNKKLYKSLKKTNRFDILSPTYVLGARKCYLVVKNTDYISQGAFAYDITIGYTSAYVEINYRSNGFALSTVARHLLRRYYELIDLPRPTEDLNVARAVINVGEFIKRYEKFLKDPEVAEMMGQVSEKDSRIAVAEELKNLGKVAQAYNLLDDAKRIYRNSSDIYSKAGDRKLQEEVLGNLAIIDKKQRQIDNSKEIRIHIKKING